MQFRLDNKIDIEGLAQFGEISSIIIYLLNTFTPLEKRAIIFVIAQVEKLLIGQKLQNRARYNHSVIGHAVLNTNCTQNVSLYQVNGY